MNLEHWLFRHRHVVWAILGVAAVTNLLLSWDERNTVVLVVVLQIMSGSAIYSYVARKDIFIGIAAVSKKASNFERRTVAAVALLCFVGLLWVG